MQGPNIKKLISQRMAYLAIPPGTKNGLQAGINFLMNPKKLSEVAKQATLEIEASIKAVRLAADPNPFRNSSDEEIAAEILKKLDERKRERWRKSV